MFGGILSDQCSQKFTAELIVAKSNLLPWSFMLLSFHLLAALLSAYEKYGLTMAKFHAAIQKCYKTAATLLDHRRSPHISYDTARYLSPHAARFEAIERMMSTFLKTRKSCFFSFAIARSKIRKINIVT